MSPSLGGETESRRPCIAHSLRMFFLSVKVLEDSRERESVQFPPGYQSITLQIERG